MNILGIETSCDETAVAVVRNGTEVLSSVVATSHEFHAQFGGILPELASRKQLEFMIPTLKEAITNAFPHVNNKTIQQCINEQIDAIAVTIGPGLVGSLLIGVECAKTIAIVTNKPIIPVNHVLAHPYANFIQNPKSNIQNPISFPAIALVVSGGHTELFLMKSEKEMKWIGGTIDDAAGEAFDKSARLLGLENGGGKALEELILKSNIQHPKSNIQLPRPLLRDGTLNFSFSGLKTAIQREYSKISNTKLQIPNINAAFAYEIQEAITDVLVAKTLNAAEMYNATSILLGGGVSANKRLREKFIQPSSSADKPSSHPAIQPSSNPAIQPSSHPTIQPSNHPTIHFPDYEFCTDNAAVIASYAFFHYLPQNYREITATPNLSVEVK